MIILKITGAAIMLALFAFLLFYIISFVAICAIGIKVEVNNLLKSKKSFRKCIDSDSFCSIACAVFILVSIVLAIAKG